MTSPPPSGGGSPRARLLLAGGITALLVVLVAAVLLLTGEEKKHEFEAAPADCVASWNQDSTALVIGQHQATAHRYSQVEVVRFGPDHAIVSNANSGAPCGLVFASSSLDSELAAAALVQGPAGWRPLSDVVKDTKALSDLQLRAREDYNAIIQPNGTLDPL
jgi:hypothetical protein